MSKKCHIFYRFQKLLICISSHLIKIIIIIIIIIIIFAQGSSSCLIIFLVNLCHFQKEIVHKLFVSSETRP